MIDFLHRRHLRCSVTDNQIHSHSCTTQSLYCPHIIHITAVKITVAIIYRWVIFSCCVIVAFVERTENGQINANKRRGLK